MGTLNQENLSGSVYFRLNPEILEQLKKRAIKNERTLSSEIRWLLLKGLREDSPDESDRH